MPELLLEIFSEEVPARMQQRAAADLRKLAVQGLDDSALPPENGDAEFKVATWATPRRLGLHVANLAAFAPTRHIERKGPREGAPEAAIAGFLRSTGLARESLELRPDGKGASYFARMEFPGQDAATLVANLFQGLLNRFPWPKTMRWGAGDTRWVRPVRRLLCTLTNPEGSTIVPLGFAGLTAGNISEYQDGAEWRRFEVTSPASYWQKLEQAGVILDFDERRQTIVAHAEAAARQSGGELVSDTKLASEVTGLLEVPIPLAGSIDARFHELPGEVLREVMRRQQKYFAVRNRSCGKVEGFVAFTDRRTADNGKTILNGNQKVLAARLSDAMFFWNDDLSTARNGLDKWQKALRSVTFHTLLGSQGERSERLARLARWLAAYTDADADKCELAARICKADLCSRMVQEFPELQGVMGRYYSVEAGFETAVAYACQEHYAPLGPADATPGKAISITVALADKIDLLACMWSIGAKPTGSGDPYALRRAALGVIRIVLERQVPLPLKRAFINAGFDAVGSDLLEFMQQRLRIWWRQKDMRHDLIEAALNAPESDDFSKVAARLEALGTVVKTDAGSKMTQTFVRAYNLAADGPLQAELKIPFAASEADGSQWVPPATENTVLDAEQAARQALTGMQPLFRQSLAAGDFTACLQVLADQSQHIQRFLDCERINVDDVSLTRRRHAILVKYCRLALSVVDMRLIQG